MKRYLRLALCLSLSAWSLGPTAPAALALSRNMPAPRAGSPLAPLRPAVQMQSPQNAHGLPSASATSRPFQADASQSGGGATIDLAADAARDENVELLVSAPEQSDRTITKTVYPLALSKARTSLKAFARSMRRQLDALGLPTQLLEEHAVTAVGTVAPINTAILRAPAKEADSFTRKLESLGFSVQRGRIFEIPQPQASEPTARTVGLKEMAVVIGADKLQAELAKVLGAPPSPGQKKSQRSSRPAAVENPVLPWAVLDSWVSVKHPFLLGHFIKSVANEDDGEAHGTHTAGTVVAMDPWNVHGRNYNIFPNGSASEGDILLKLAMAQEDGALGTTNSWGDGSGNPEGAIEKLFVKTAAMGVHHSISAGNSGSRKNTIGGPAIASFVVELVLGGKVIGHVKRIKAIAASDADKATADFSSRGPGSPTTSRKPDVYKDYPAKPDESAVGVNLVAPVPRGSTVPELGGPGGKMSGTSMSNPGAFGAFLLLTRAILVLLKSDLPVLSTAEQTKQFAMDLARYAMTMTAEKGAPAIEVGDGFINVWNAFQFAAKMLPAPSHHR